MSKRNNISGPFPSLLSMNELNVDTSSMLTKTFFYKTLPEEPAPRHNITGFVALAGRPYVQALLGVFLTTGVSMEAPSEGLE